MISLSYGGHTETLPSGYCWTDEFGQGNANKVQVIKWLLPQYGVSAILIQETVRGTGGQTVTLGDENGPGQMPRGQLDQLKTWADLTPAPVITLAMDGRASQSVQFFNANGPAIEARPVLWQEPPDADDPYWVTLHFIRA